MVTKERQTTQVSIISAALVVAGVMLAGRQVSAAEEPSGLPVAELSRDTPVVFQKEILPILKLLGVGSIKSNPEEDKSRVCVISLLLRLIQPAQSAMNPHAHGLWKCVSDFALSQFEGAEC